MADLKKALRDFWSKATCGQRLLLDVSDKPGFRNQMARRYALEPYIDGFARFYDAWELDVLEIGVGLGADHLRCAEAGARLTGITPPTPLSSSL